MNTKFNPKEVPHWVRWIAVDGNGDEWGYSLEPKKNYYTWGWMPSSMRTKAASLCKGKPPKDWTTELYTWK